MADILLVSTWGTACGIAEHSAELVDAVHTQSDLKIDVSAEALDPFTDFRLSAPPKILHLNYHAALHSKWTPLVVKAWREEKGIPVVVTYHDTGVPNSDQAKALHDVCDAMIVHEPADDLPKAHYWRMGVPSATGHLQFGSHQDWFAPAAEDGDRGIFFKAYDAQPVLGTIGFPFPWKNYDELARVTGEIGWALVLIAPTATQSQIEKWRSLNPYSWIRTDFVKRHEALTILSGCDATAFCYVCHNTGQSAAILQGIAARKPVIALDTCRQFRALASDYLGARSIHWCQTFDQVAEQLRLHVPIQRCSPAIVALAEQESWKKVGQKYIGLYQELLGR